MTGTVNVMLTCGTILRERDYPDSMPLPVIGDEIELDDVRYRVAARVWEYPKDASPAVNIVLVHTEDYWYRSP